MANAVMEGSVSGVSDKSLHTRRAHDPARTGTPWSAGSGGGERPSVHDVSIHAALIQRLRQSGKYYIPCALSSVRPDLLTLISVLHGSATRNSIGFLFAELMALHAYL